MKRNFENPSIKDQIYFQQFAEEPGDGTTIIDVTLAPGGGNGLHYHLSFDEIFECLEGEVSIQVGNKVQVLQPGETAVAPRKSVHRFFNQSQAPARFRVTLTPGHVGFEKVIKIVYGLAADGRLKKDGGLAKFWQMGVVVELSDTNVPGFFSLVMPLLRRSARRALADGRFDRELRPYLAQ
ncbi:cupin domain-containing protein [Hymenobacter busanensis]|nr:cupin domain-containing protein [Hymenobacter busanensis]QHJ08952.1 cupin domain-containing protein [Hymenobacter busanensis]